MVIELLAERAIAMMPSFYYNEIEKKCKARGYDATMIIGLAIAIRLLNANKLAFWSSALISKATIFRGLHK